MCFRCTVLMYLCVRCLFSVLLFTVDCRYVFQAELYIEAVAFVKRPFLFTIVSNNLLYVTVCLLFN
jgi:hypothetical protein